MINERFADDRAQTAERSESERRVAARAKMLSHGVITATLLLFAAWSAFVIVYPVLGNGWMYRVKQPVPVVAEFSRSPDSRVLLRFERYSMWTIRAFSSRELHCDSVQRLPPEDVVVEAGSSSFVIGLPFPSSVINSDKGEARCYYAGALVYRPFGDYGPQIIYEWLSEEFFVNRRLAK